MDVAGSILGALTGSSGPQVEIRLTPPPPTPSSSSPLTPVDPNHPSQHPMIVPLDHYPSWRLHKNPFWRVKHPSGDRLVHRQHQAIAPPPQPGMGDGFQPHHHSKEAMFAYEGSQDVEGVVVLRLPPGKKVEHLGIKVQFIGRIDMSVGIHEGKPHYDFISLSKELAPPGTLYQPETTMSFKFGNMEKEYESYHGRNVSVRYIIKFVMERKFLPPLTKEHDVWVQLLGKEPTENEAIKMEVGIEDCLHIEFEYDRRVHHLQDTICGKIHFLLVRIKIKHMELAVIRRETSGEGVAIAAANAEGPTSASTVDANNIFTETQTLVKYEIMDGAPVKGEMIPVKLRLQGIPADLTPTYTAVNNRFSVRYFLNLVLVDEDDRRYFKQQEIILWRKELG